MSKRSPAVALAAAVIAVLSLVFAPMASAEPYGPSEQVPPLTATGQPMDQTNNFITALASVGGVLYAGGNFTTVRPAGAARGVSEQTQPYLAAFDAASGRFISSWRPAVTGGSVYALNISPDGTRLYVGGSFSKVNGQAQSKIAAFDLTSPAAPKLLSKTQFKASASALVNAIASTNTTVWAGGNFNSAGGSTRNLVAAFSASNGSLLPFKVQISGASAPYYTTPFVSALTESNGRLYIGGMFNTVNNATQHALAVVDETTGATDPGFAIPSILPYSYVVAMTIDSGRLSISGRDDKSGSSNRLEGVMTMDAATGTILWGSDGHRCLGDTFALKVFQGVLWAGTHAHDCGQIGTHPESNPRFYASVLGADPATGQQLNFYPSVAGKKSIPGSMNNVRAFATDGTNLFAAGGWLTVNGQASQNLIKFSPGKPSAPPLRVTPSVSSRSTGGAQVTWQASSDIDNRTLTYSVFRNGSATPLTTFTADSAFWDRPQLSYVDAGATPGMKVYYNVSVSDGDTTVKSLKSNTITLPTAPTSYAAAVAGDGANLYWRFDDAPGSSTAADSTSKGNAGQASGNVAFGGTGALSTAPNAAVGFDGTGRLASTSSFANPTSYSEELWFNTSSTTGGKLIGLGNAQSGDSSNYDRHVYMTNGGQLVFGAYTGAAVTVTSPNSYADGAWHYLVATQGTDGMKLYVDGALVDSNANAASQSYTGYLRVGGDSLNGWPNQPSSFNYSGQLDEVAFYPYVLSADQVAAHFALR